MVGCGFIIVKENGETEMDDATEQLLIEMGVFRDLRCPYCDANNHYHSFREASTA
jgi:hypothetical protein